MSFPDGNAKDTSKRAFELAMAAGISLKPTESKFCDKLMAWMKVGDDDRKQVFPLISALERTLNRSHDDSRLVLSLCTAIQEYSGMNVQDFLKKVERSAKFLEKPVSSALVKTVRQASVTALHPRVIEIPDLDAIEVLAKAPRESIRAVEGTQDVLQVGTESIDLGKSGKKEIAAAVRKVRAEKKIADAPPPAPEQAIAEISYVPDEEGGVPEELGSELDDAAAALSRLLRAMPRTSRLSGLAEVIEQAQRLLELTRRDLSLYPKPNADEAAAESMN